MAKNILGHQIFSKQQKSREHHFQILFYCLNIFCTLFKFITDLSTFFSQKVLFIFCRLLQQQIPYCNLICFFPLQLSFEKNNKEILGFIPAYFITTRMNWKEIRRSFERFNRLRYTSILNLVLMWKLIVI